MRGKAYIRRQPLARRPNAHDNLVHHYYPLARRQGRLRLRLHLRLCALALGGTCLEILLITIRNPLGTQGLCLAILTMPALPVTVGPRDRSSGVRDAGSARFDRCTGSDSARGWGSRSGACLRRWGVVHKSHARTAQCGHQGRVLGEGEDPPRGLTPAAILQPCVVHGARGL